MAWRVADWSVKACIVKFICTSSKEVILHSQQSYIGTVKTHACLASIWTGFESFGCEADTYAAVIKPVQTNY